MVPWEGISAVRQSAVDPASRCPNLGSPPNESHRTRPDPRARRLRTPEGHPRASRLRPRALLAQQPGHRRHPGQGRSPESGRVDRPDPELRRLRTRLDRRADRGLAVALDDVSMWLAYKFFEIAQMADGQESSTRYIAMDAANVPSAEELGIPEDLAPAGARSSPILRRLPRRSTPGSTRSPWPLPAVRMPADAKPAVAARLRKNYALDRARYSSARHPDQCRARPVLPDVGADGQAAGFAPASGGPGGGRSCARSSSSSRPGSCATARRSRPPVSRPGQELATSLSLGASGCPPSRSPDEVWVHVDRSTPPWLPELQPVPEALRHRSNRYGSRGPRPGGCGSCSPGTTWPWPSSAT